MRLPRSLLLAILASACGTQAGTGPAAHAAPSGEAAAPRSPAGLREIAAGLPEAVRVVYVSPSGSGNGVSAESPKKLQRAVDASKPGDEIRLLPGEYEGKIRVTTGGTAEHPVVIRNQPGSLPRLKGWIHVDDGVPSVWIVGLEITLPEAAKGDACIQMQGEDVRAINNYVHDCAQNGIAAWRGNRSSTGGQLVYGNVVARSDHGMYAQNRYSDEGYKRFVRNLILDTQKACEKNCFSFHGYTENGWNSGLWVEDSVVRGARFMIGGTNGHTRHTVLKNNVFYEASPQIAYTSPAQHDDVSGNVVYKSQFTVGFWATDGPSRFTNNELMNPAPGMQLNDLRPVGPGEAPAAVKDPGGKSHMTAPKKGPPQPARFNPQDVIDGNTYLAEDRGSIRSSWWLPEKRQDCCREKTLAQFRSDLQATGCSNCEANARTVSAPASPRVFLWDNAYERGRGQLAIYRSGRSGDPVAVDLSKVVAPGAAFAIVRAADGPASAPVVAGTYQGGTVSVPTSEEFDVFLVVPGGTNAGGAGP